jgi:SnoaL-like domain
LRHLAVNLEISGDGQAARARCYLLTVIAGSAAAPGATGVYRDDLGKVYGRWRFTSRQISVDA